MDAMTAILALIRAGVIEVRPSGEIWKVARMDWKGRVKPATPRRAETTLANGYLGVKVCWKGRQYLALAHRVVWTVLSGPIPEGMEINHRDGVKANNSPENLEVVTSRENVIHAIRTGLTPRRGWSPERRARLRAGALQLRAKGLSYREVGNALGVSQTSAFRLAA